MDSYGSRPPFKSFYHKALASYIDHGFTELPGEKLVLGGFYQLLRLGASAQLHLCNIVSSTSFFCCMESSRGSLSDLPLSGHLS